MFVEKLAYKREQQSAQHHATIYLPASEAVAFISNLPFCIMGLPGWRKLSQRMGDPSGMVTLKGKVPQPLPNQGGFRDLLGASGLNMHGPPDLAAERQLGSGPPPAKSAMAIWNLMARPTAREPTSPLLATSAPGGRLQMRLGLSMVTLPSAPSSTFRPMLAHHQAPAQYRGVPVGRSSSVLLQPICTKDSSRRGAQPLLVRRLGHRLPACVSLPFPGWDVLCSAHAQQI